jgi:ribose-phosphate pyrophosphokinase
MRGNEMMTKRLASQLAAETGELLAHNFPDGETGLRYGTQVAGRDVVLVCTMARPNGRFLPLAFAAAAARDQGASRVGLAAPYLSYMRQDRQFAPGEAVTSRIFARLLSNLFDWLVTIDPHLHRYAALNEIYSIPTTALHAGPIFAEWISNNIQAPFLIGPDEESRQWVQSVAKLCGAPFSVLRKQRLGDQAVRMEAMPEIPCGRTPVLLDDIISSGATVQQAVRLLPQDRAVVVAAIHGVFAGGVLPPMPPHVRLVTSNTIPNPAAEIDLLPLLADGIASRLASA